jgi:hypothetical protein
MRRNLVAPLRGAKGKYLPDHEEKVVSSLVIVKKMGIRYSGDSS